MCSFYWVAKLNIASQGAGPCVIGKVLKGSRDGTQSSPTPKWISIGSLSVYQFKAHDLTWPSWGIPELLRKGIAIPILQVKTPQLWGLRNGRAWARAWVFWSRTLCSPISSWYPSHKEHSYDKEGMWHGIPYKVSSDLLHTFVWIPSHHILGVTPSAKFLISLGLQILQLWDIGKLVLSSKG